MDYDKNSIVKDSIGDVVDEELFDDSDVESNYESSSTDADIAMLPVASSEGGRISRCATDQLSRYIDEVGRVPSLTQEEEFELIRDYQENGNKISGHKVIKSHLKLVVKIAFSYKNYGLLMLDVICEGNLGLIKALEKFDIKKGFRFSTYASWWIKSGICEFVLNSWSLVKMSNTRAKKMLFFNLNKIRKVLGLSSGCLGSDEARKVADYAGVSSNDVVAISNMRSYSLDSNLNDDGLRLSDCLAGSTNVEQEFAEHSDRLTQMELIGVAMKSLTDRESKIIEMRYLRDKSATLDEISKIMNISKERVRQIESNAITKIANYAKNS